MLGTMGHLGLMGGVHCLLEEENNEAKFLFITGTLLKSSSLCLRYAQRLTMKPWTVSPLSFRKGLSGIYLGQALFQVEFKHDLGFPTAHILGDEENSNPAEPSPVERIVALRSPRPESGLYSALQWVRTKHSSQFTNIISPLRKLRLSAR